MLTETLVNSAGNRDIYEQKLRTTSTGDQKQDIQIRVLWNSLSNRSKRDLAANDSLNNSNEPIVIDRRYV